MSNGGGVGKTIGVVVVVVLLLGTLICGVLGYFLYSTAQNIVTGSGVPATQTYEVRDFTGVTNHLDADVEVLISEGFGVQVEGDDDLLPHLGVRVLDGNLVLDADALLDPQTPMKVTVNMPVVKRLASVGSGDIELKHLEAQEFEVKLVGSGDVEVEGTAAKLTVSVIGSGEAQLSRLVATQADVKIVGSGDAHVHVTGELGAKIVGSGDIVHVGGASVTEEITGGGTVHEAK